MRIRSESVDGGVGELERAIDALPFSEDLKEAIARELLDQSRFPHRGTLGLFYDDDSAATIADEGPEVVRIAVPFRLGQRGKILAAAFRALVSDAECDVSQFDHVRI